MLRTHRTLGITAATAAVAATLATGLTGLGLAGPAAARTAHPDRSTTCPPSASAVSYSDALDKKIVDGAEIGGLSDIAYDPRTRSYVSSVDNHADDPSRLWFYRDLSDPTIVGDPLVLKKPDGTPYDGETADDEGLGVLPNGDFVVSSEVEPSIRIFGHDGVQKASLPVPARFAVEPAGESTGNATFEGLTVGRGGRQIVVSMEGTLSGDTGDGTFRRLLVYSKSHGGYRLTRQVAYRVDDGMRIPEIQEYAPGRLLVMEASWSEDVGNEIMLYAVDLTRARDVSRITDLATAPQTVMHKTLVADVTACPDLGATAKETQANPLMDNYEGMTTRPLGHGSYAVTLLSDDNFGEAQWTRFLNLVARLP
ncbi:esterase-like activity of phytase family protein [Nocardioides sp. KR10-350]|uniref:esterase-like activity of phytase family protein n=1 Tax=Nocardioides cheoyonin TaxID=3156615 RepID=UPI0032B316E5